jgi:hypothetical protein
VPAGARAWARRARRPPLTRGPAAPRPHAAAFAPPDGCGGALFLHAALLIPCSEIEAWTLTDARMLPACSQLDFVYKSWWAAAALARVVSKSRQFSAILGNSGGEDAPWLVARGASPAMYAANLRSGRWVHAWCTCARQAGRSASAAAWALLAARRSSYWSAPIVRVGMLSSRKLGGTWRAGRGWGTRVEYRYRPCGGTTGSADCAARPARARGPSRTFLRSFHFPLCLLVCEPATEALFVSRSAPRQGLLQKEPLG